MSRVGQAKISIPDKVKIEFKDQKVTVKGEKETLSRSIPDLIDVSISDKIVEVKRKNNTTQAKALHGLTRTLIYNMVLGVTKGFERVLEINGLGYKIQPQGQVLNVSLGHSHPIQFDLPKGAHANVQGNKLVLSGPDKEILGSIAADLRKIRPPEPYKGKGVKYAEEVIQRKVGKTGATGA